MSTLFDKWRINPGLVRIILFRVLPGHEVEVGRRIEKECKRFGMPRGSFRVFRLFGSYDLVFVQDASKLIQSEFAKLGTIPGVTGSTEYLCYNWVRTSGKSKPMFSIKHLSKPLVGLCFLKINPVLSERLGLEAELQFADCISKTDLRFGGTISKMDRSVQMLGTMGWSEIVLVISDSSLAGILHRIGDIIPSLGMWQADGQPEVFAEKTFTMIGHDLDVSDPKRGKHKVVSLAKELRNGNLEIHFPA